MPKPIALPALLILFITLLVKFPNKPFSQLKRVAIECSTIPTFADSLEEISINDNRKTAGIIEHGVLNLELEVRAGIWYPESHEGKGLRVYAFAEKGNPCNYPGPSFGCRKEQSSGLPFATWYAMHHWFCMAFIPGRKKIQTAF